MEKLFYFLTDFEDIQSKIKLKQKAIERLQKEILQLEEMLNSASSNQNKNP